MQFFPRRYKGRRVLKKSHRTGFEFAVVAALCCICLLGASAPIGYERDVMYRPIQRGSTTEKVLVFSKMAHTEFAPRSIPAQPDPIDWYVTSGELSDPLGNLRTVMNFCTYAWADAYSWLQENYVEGWPHSRVKEDRLPINLGQTIGIAVATNAMRESGGIPGTLQGRGCVAESYSAVGTTDMLLSMGSSGGQAWGIIQWDGGRRYNLAQFCAASDLDPRSLKTQLLYLAYEYYASAEYGSYSELISTYSGAEVTLTNTAAAAEVFRAKVERGGVPHSGGPILENWGNKWDSAWGEKPAGGLFTYLTTE